MALQRMDNVLIVVDDLEAAKTPWVDSTLGLDDVHADVTMMRTQTTTAGSS
jgi:hypothetical protein